MSATPDLKSSGRRVTVTPDGKSGRRGLLIRTIGSLVSGLAVAFAFPPYDLVWLMPIGLAGLMVTVRGARSWRAGFGLGFCFGMGFMLPLMRWITIIGPDAWVALAVLEALFYGLMGVGWALAAQRTLVAGRLRAHLGGRRVVARRHSFRRPPVGQAGVRAGRHAGRPVGQGGRDRPGLVPGGARRGRGRRCGRAPQPQRAERRSRVRRGRPRGGQPRCCPSGSPVPTDRLKWSPCRATCRVRGWTRSPNAGRCCDNHADATIAIRRSRSLPVAIRSPTS